MNARQWRTSSLANGSTTKDSRTYAEAAEASGASFNQCSSCCAGLWAGSTSSSSRRRKRGEDLDNGPLIWRGAEPFVTSGASHRLGCALWSSSCAAAGIWRFEPSRLPAFHHLVVSRASRRAIRCALGIQGVECVTP
jgi:hypothetical protein